MSEKAKLLTAILEPRGYDLIFARKVAGIGATKVCIGHGKLCCKFMIPDEHFHTEYLECFIDSIQPPDSNN